MAKHRTGTRVGDPKTALPPFVIKRISEGSFILVLTTAFFVLLSLLTYHTNDPGFSHASQPSAYVGNAGGQVGAYIADALYVTFGYFAYLLPLCFAYVAWIILKDHRAFRVVNKPMLLLRGAGFVFMLSGGCGLLGLELQANAQVSGQSSGGVVGSAIAVVLNNALNVQGTTVLLLAMLLVGVTW